MTDKLALWKRVSITDPKAVKKITGKQYQGNSPKPYWIIERLTQEFGPCGIGWGFTILNERMERLTEQELLHVAVVRLWYVMDDKRGEFEQIGQTRAVYVKNDKSLMIDEDAPKKSVTDALVKCASYLGFAGDIFSGRWDDSKYVEHANREWREREQAAELEQNADRTRWLADQEAAISGAKSVGELKTVVAEAVRVAMAQNDSAAVDQINAWAEAKKATAKAKATA